MSQISMPKNNFLRVPLNLYYKCSTIPSYDFRVRCMMNIMWPTSQSHFYVSYLILVEIKFSHCHSCVMFVMKSTSV